MDVQHRLSLLWDFTFDINLQRARMMNSMYPNELRRLHQLLDQSTTHVPQPLGTFELEHYMLLLNFISTAFLNVLIAIASNVVILSLMLRFLASEEASYLLISLPYL